MGHLWVPQLATILREVFRWTITQDNSNEEIDGFKYLILVNEEWYTTTSKDKGEQFHSGLEEEEYLSSSEKNLDEHFEKELNPLRNIM